MPKDGQKSASGPPLSDLSASHAEIVTCGPEIDITCATPVARNTRKTPAPSTDDVVAAMTFGFWTNLFRTFSSLEAPNIIPAIFPHHHVLSPNQWGSKKVRT